VLFVVVVLSFFKLLCNIRMLNILNLVWNVAVVVGVNDEKITVSLQRRALPLHQDVTLVR
jgi:hypothetical protein